MRIVLISLLGAVLLLSCKQDTQSLNTILKAVEAQLEGLRVKSMGKQALPRSLTPEKSDIRWCKNNLDWTEGFFPGSCWMMYQETKDEKWKVSALELQHLFESHKDDRSTHDLGFIFNNSYGKAWRIMGEETYKKVIIDAAGSLVSRYNDSIGCIKSWDWAGDRWIFPVIVDNMMNLELLFEVFNITGDSLYYNIAKRHAMTTLKNHYREDHSSYHVVDYDLNGAVRWKGTHQGYADSSSWSRGQAWGLYGYTICFRYTQDSLFLKQAEVIAEYLVGILPVDVILPWDSRAPDSTLGFKDASASAIMASALIELSAYSSTDYTEVARKILHALADKEYMAAYGTNFSFVLKHCVGSFPEKSEVDVPLVYGDYYFLEALLRLKSLEENKAFDYKAIP